MIEQQELRPDSRIMVNNKNYRIVYLSNNEHVQPIELKEKILEKAGFKKDEYGFKNGQLSLNMTKYFI